MARGDRDRRADPIRLVVHKPDDDEWQVDLIPLPIAFDDDRDARPAVAMIVAADRVVHHELAARALADVADIAAMLARSVTAAAACFRARPWRTFENPDLIRFDLASDTCWWLTVMGAGGEEFGLAIYQRREDVDAILAGRLLRPPTTR